MKGERGERERERRRERRKRAGRGGTKKGTANRGSGREWGGQGDSRGKNGES